MQNIRTQVRRVPQQLHRITKPNLTTRNFINTTPAMSLFPRFTQEFAPFFRLMDDYDRRAFRDINAHFKEARSFTPKFDVKEVEGAYELHGEFPGIEQKDISIEWTDTNTLTVKGRHERVREEGTKPKALIEENKEGKHYEKPSVQDEAAETDTATSSKPEEAAHGEVAKTGSQDVAQQAENGSKYWVSERSVGEFHRSFSFPTRIDQDAVKASLKNGILSVIVPKAKAQQPRKVTIE